jgi:hypothetical protein
VAEPAVRRRSPTRGLRRPPTPETPRDEPPRRAERVAAFCRALVAETTPEETGRGDALVARVRRHPLGELLVDAVPGEPLADRERAAASIAEALDDVRRELPVVEVAEPPESRYRPPRFTLATPRRSSAACISRSP